jgi:protocatechuate 3,4-dioxygenase beta subunit
MIGAAMVSLSRRQVLIGGTLGIIAPAITFASQRTEKLVLSGRITRHDGKPLAGARFAIGKDRITTDADGRFMLVTDTAYPASSARRDHEGTWRATIGVTL